MTEYTPTTEVVREQWGNAVDYYRSPQQRLPLFDLWYAEEIRKAKEEAWEEGWDKGFDVADEAYRYGSMDASGDNPYRKEQND